MATHSSVLAWRVPGTGEPGGLPSMGSHRVGHAGSDSAAAAAADIMGFPGSSAGKESTCTAGDLGSRQHRLKCFSFFTEQNMHVLLTPVGMKDAQLLLLSHFSRVQLCVTP